MSPFKMEGFATFQIWMFAAVFIFAKTKASTITFEAYPSVVKANLTNSVSMRCNLADTHTNNGQIGKRSVVMTTTDDIVHISAIHVTRNNGEDVASVTPFDAPMALVDQGNLEVKGDVSGISSQGYLELSWKDPSSMAVGGYTCEISTTDARQQTVVFKTSLEIAEVAPTINDLILELKATQLTAEKQQGELASQKHEINDLKQRQNKLKDCTSHRVGFMSAISQSNFNGQSIFIIAKNQPVVFDKMIYSMGGGYDNKTGLFTCAEPGVYHFSVHATAAHGNDIDLDLMLNSELITSFYAYDQDTVAPGSASAVLKLKLDDVVRVVTAANYQNEFFQDLNVMQANVFMGHLIQSDDCVV